MALNYPGPYQVRIFYSVSSRVHVVALNVQMSVEGSVGDPFSDFIPLQRNGSAVTTLDTHVDNFVTVAKPFINTGQDFDFAELWKYTPDTFEADFISSYTLGVAGTSGSATKNASQLIWTFRTQEGGSMRVVLMDTTYDQAITVPYGSMDTPTKALADDITAGTNVWLARDTSYPFNSIAMFPGSNEALFKKIYRP
jgi:hypothetical protein